MSYSEYTGSTAARPFRVVLGGLLAFACCLVGTIVMTHEYHRALMMQDEPEELDWQTLAERGPVGNAFVRLTDVQLDQTDPMEDFEKMFGEFDPNDDPEEALEAFVESMEVVNPLQMVEMVCAPVKVVPKDAAGNVREAIVIPRIDSYVAAAQQQLEETGTLSGLVNTYQGDEFIKAVMTYAGGEEMVEEFEEMGLDQKVYTIEPMTETLDDSVAAWNFWLFGLGMSFGLILCGSGGPSLSTCVFFTKPSILSLLGYPMRYGRGGNLTRAIYILIGGGLLFYGYKLMFQLGHFGEIGGSPIFHSLGFICTFFGVAAVLAVPSQIISRKVEASLDVAPSKKHEVKMTVEQACSLKPLETVEKVYLDRDLIACDEEETPDRLKQLAEDLTLIGFEPAESRAWLSGEEDASPATFQIGCQNMVVADIEIVDGRARHRMTSMLHDGMSVITLAGIDGLADRRVGSNGTYQRSKSDDVEQMLAQHLEQTISIAERRDTSVVTFEPTDIDDVCHLSRRVLADVQYQYGETTIEVDPAFYGRFRFPMQPILEAAAV